VPATPSEIDGQLDADQRLDALLAGLFGEFEGAEQVAGIGNAERRLAVILGQPENGLELQGPLQQGIGRMDVKMDEAGTAHG
jgi:hypothetical protein